MTETSGEGQGKETERGARSELLGSEAGRAGVVLPLGDGETGSPALDPH